MRLLFVLPFLMFSPLLFAQEQETREQVVIVEEEETPAPTLKLIQTFKEMFHFEGTLDNLTYYQLTPLNEQPIRPLVGAFLEIDFLPDSFWQVKVSGLGRIGLDLGTQTPIAGPPMSVVGFSLLEDTYLRLNSEYLMFWAGRMVVRWSPMNTIILADRLNPVNYARGPMFPRSPLGRMPQDGLRLVGTYDWLTLDAVMFLDHIPSHYGFAATTQSGYQVGRYEQALEPNSAQMRRLDERQYLQYALFNGFLHSWQAGLNMKVALSDVDLSFIAAYVYDDVPTVTPGINGTVVGYEKTFTVSASVAWNAGPVIVKAEALYEPLLPDQGKPTLLIKDGLLYSKGLNFFGATAGVEASYGDIVTANLELFDLVFFDVPARASIQGIEPVTASEPYARNVQRAGIGLDVKGAALLQRLEWGFRGEIGIWRTDISAMAELRYWLAPQLFQIGAFANIFEGTEGSPGNFRRQLTAFGISLLVPL